jgi:photosystem II stability/assembly factor-like uncharacterized protein
MVSMRAAWASLTFVCAMALMAACAAQPRDPVMTREHLIEEGLPPMKEVCNGFLLQKPSDRMTWRFAKMTFPLNTVPRGALLTALQQIATLKAALPSLPAARWVSIGPAPIIAFDSVAQVERPMSGRVAGVAVDPSDPAHWLIGAAHGGIWETRDSGKTWAPRTDDQFSLAMGAIAFAPSNPRIVYAGTGEAVFSRSTYGGEGLLKSDTGGRTWAPLAFVEFSGVAFSHLAIDASNPDVLVAATTRAGVASIPGTLPVRGILKSKSGGGTGTWAQTLPGEATDLKVNPRDFSSQYAGIGDICGDLRNGLYRSTDAGDRWRRIEGPWMAGGSVGRIELAIAPSRPDVVYVSIQRAPDTSGDGGDLIGLWRTDNAWAAAPAWREIVGALDLDLGSGARGTYCSVRQGPSQCWYDHVLSVDPENPDVLYAGGIDLWRYDGVRWDNIGKSQKTRPGIHVDQHAMVWAGRRLIVGNDGGVWSTSNAGLTWEVHNEGLATSQVWKGSIDPVNDQTALAGNQDDGTVRWMGSAGWPRIFGGDGAASAIAKGNPATHWAVSSQRAGFVRTVDGGALFTRAAGVISSEPEETRPFITQLEKCPHNDDVFVAGTIKPWRTEDFFRGSGPDWKVNGPSMPRLIRAMTFAPSDSTCRTYAFGTLDGQLRLTKTGGGNPSEWSDLDPDKLVPGRVVTGLAFYPGDASTLYVTVGGFDQGTPLRPGHLFRTTNALSPSPRWASVSGTSNVPHNAVAIDPVDPQVIYVATDMGVWYTADSGMSWRHMGPETGLPNVAVADVRIHTRTRRVFAFTFGRGVFVLDRALSAIPPPGDLTVSGGASTRP